MLGSITRACALHGQDLLVSFQQLSTDWQADYEDSNKADGIILLGYGDYHESRDRLQRLVEQGTHFVRWAPPCPASRACRSAATTSRAGMTSPPTCCSRAAAASPSSAMPPAITPNSRNATAATSRPCRTTAWPPNRRCSTMRSPPRLPARSLPGAAGAWRADRCDLRRQRPDRHRCDARPARGRATGAAGRGGDRLRRHPAGARCPRR